MAGTAMSRAEQMEFEKDFARKRRASTLQQQVGHQQGSRPLNYLSGFHAGRYRGNTVDDSDDQNKDQDFKRQLKHLQHLAANPEIYGETTISQVQKLLLLRDHYSLKESDAIMEIFKSRLDLVDGDPDDKLLTVLVKSNLNQGSLYSLTLRASIKSGRTDLVKYLIEHHKKDIDFQVYNNLPIKLAFTSSSTEKWDIMKLLIPFVNSLRLLDMLHAQVHNLPLGPYEWNNRLSKLSLAYSVCTWTSLAQDCWRFAQYASDQELDLLKVKEFYLQGTIELWLSQQMTNYLRSQNLDWYLSQPSNQWVPRVKS